MNYAFINICNPIETQKSIIQQIAKIKREEIDVWLELDICILNNFSKSYFKENDNVFISNLKLFKSECMITTMNVLKICSSKKIKVFSQENLDKSPLYLICLLNKIAS
ncbi:MAG: hypothetical protein HRT68_04405 [Flavobacteriaceae bacterium]|nr:hypothetical protein [Flavobacteriaceae bacterium]